MDALISIIVPVFNAEDYIEECLRSIVKQTYTNLEILLIDDGSTDSSGGICDEYANKDIRIRVVHKQNEGVSAARNTGLDLAKGEYIAFVDSDDFVDKNYILYMYGKMAEQNADLVFCRYSKIMNKTVINVQENLPKNIDVNKDNKIFLAFLGQFFSFKENILGSCWRLLLKRKQLLSLRFDTNIRICEDLLFVFDYILSSKIITSIDNHLYFYRQIESSACHSYKKNYLENQLFLYTGIRKRFDLIGNDKLKKSFDVYNSLLCYYCFSNEIKFKQVNWRNNIQKVRDSELYEYFNLKNGLKIYGYEKKIKFLIIWFLVKTRLA